MDKELPRLPEYIKPWTVTEQIDPYRSFKEARLKERRLPTIFAEKLNQDKRP